MVLKAESRHTKPCIEIYKSEDDFLRKRPTKLVAIDQINRTQSAIERKELTLVLFGETVTFMCSSRADHDDWLKDIESVRGQTPSSREGKSSKGAPLSEEGEREREGERGGHYKSVFNYRKCLVITACHVYIVNVLYFIWLRVYCTVLYDTHVHSIL